MSVARMLDRHWDEILTKSLPPGLPDEEVKIEPILVDITDAANWIYTETDQEYFDWREDFPTIISPWPITWMEFMRSSVTRSEGQQWVMPEQALHRMGALALNWEIKEEQRALTWQVDPILRWQMQCGKLMGKPQVYPSEQIEARRMACMKYATKGLAPRWISMWEVYLELVRDKSCHHLMSAAFYLDEDGKLFDEVLMIHTDQPVGDGIFTILIPFFYGISLMHCGNVSVVPVGSDRKPNPRHGHDPRACYHVLDIKPIHRMAAASKMGSSSVKRALHICRGHFKDYRKSGLFGHYKGIYWWDMQARGTIEKGEVKKDYRVRRGNDVIQD